MGCFKRWLHEWNINQREISEPQGEMLKGAVTTEIASWNSSMSKTVKLFVHKPPLQIGNSQKCHRVQALTQPSGFTLHIRLWRGFQTIAGYCKPHINRLPSVFRVKDKRNRQVVGFKPTYLRTW